MTRHYSVLLQESIDALNCQSDGIYVDGTLGRGGHSLEIARRLQNGHLYAFDLDEQALAESAQRLAEVGDRVTLIRANFAQMREELNARGVLSVDGVVMDLGVSSPQFDDGERGFSYRYDARLDMRMDQSQPRSAWNLVNELDEKELSALLWKYGEESYSRPIARQIVRARALHPIDTTFELVDVIKKALPAKVLNKKGHPAKQTFQALRIAVNGELESLETGLRAAMSLVKPGGRIAVITFHSLEDRIVKETFRQASSVEKTDPRIPLLPSQIRQPDFRLVSRKPILPGEEELAENNRSHSAKLRVLERIGD
ncbi:16S rRNA (cytosine(1402)-N(4))-methyltransferase RsmH [Holdemania filiformis]|uniref:16S rRNA (cytosine(1402)-N(4))-methyltransferase RsmH n=1 Tax=Holdemania filiformis TaxID=61171 RepID=UPI002676885D|nr:16S rRNA (cytosine(1402)-N(4))-methyltransferase RsmH [Holdemania filiformis]